MTSGRKTVKVGGVVYRFTWNQVVTVIYCVSSVYPAYSREI